MDIRIEEFQMKQTRIAAAFVLALALAAPHADAAKRFGGGGNLGKQRPAPTATKDATTTNASTPPSTQPAQGTTAATPAQGASTAPTPSATAPLPPPKPSFMSRWGGLLAGLGIGALLASLFGTQMGPIVGLILAGLLA